jgi:hypothetical protein
VIRPCRRRHFLVFLVTITPIFTLARPGWAGVDRDRFRADLRQLCTSRGRSVGSEGYREAGPWLEEQLRALPNVDVRRHEFPVIAPITRAASFYKSGGPAAGERIYPFWPAGVRVNATSAEGITGRCVYLGEATYDRITPKVLQGQIAAVEASARSAWTNAFYFGARAVLVLGSDQATHVDLQSHDLLPPVNLPRFYVPPGKLADELRAGSIREPVTIRASVDWQRVTAANLYALVLPRGGSATSQGALAISAPYDATSLVPDLAPGASQAAQAACGLALLRHYSEHPPSRPLLFVFTGADGIDMLGTRNLFMALSDLPAHWRPEIEQTEKQLDALRRDASRLTKVASAPTALNVPSDRHAIDRVAHEIETDASLEQDELFQLRRHAAKTPDVAARERELAARQILLSRLRYTIVQRPAELNGDLAAPAAAYVERARSRLDKLIAQHEDRLAELRTRIDLYRWLAGSLGKEADPSERANDHRLIELLVALDLSDRGARFGPMYAGGYLETSNLSQIQDYRDWFARQERAFTSGQPAAAWWGGISDVIDLTPLASSRSPYSWVAGPLAIGSELCSTWGVPGFTLMTLDDLRLRRDTPADTLDHLEVDPILRQLDAVRELLSRAASDPTFHGPTELKWQRTRLTGRVVSPAPGRPVPDLPRDGFLVMCIPTLDKLSRIPRPSPHGYAIGVRRGEVRLADADGGYRFEGLSRIPEDRQLVAVEAFRAEPATGAITACSDLGRQIGDIQLYADLRQDGVPLRSVVFACEEFPLVGLYDPRFLQDLREVLPLDARRGAEPQRFNAILCDRMLAGFVEPGSRTSLVFRFGRVGNRLLLANVTASGGGGGGTDQLGFGYAPEELRAIGPLALATARDFQRLDALRQQQYRAAGVSSAVIDRMQADAQRQLAAASDAVADGRDASQVMALATGAWADDARVYAATQDLANDVVRGAIFLLLLCVPFAICLERLLLASANVYRQITGAAGIFAAMLLVLWSFHPAFRISSSPLIIVLAFAILFMSAGVTWLVYSKFDAELTRLRSGRGEPAQVAFARTTVLVSAVLLGIANMRRRRFRTGLTAITIVLITFAVLCFTSSTRYLETVTLPTGVASSYPGVMLRQRGYRPIPEAMVENLRPLLGEHRLVERWWNANPARPREVTHIIYAPAGGGPARVADATALLGLSPGESGLSRIAGVIAADKFARLERGERDIIFLSGSMAGLLGAREGDTLRVGGVDVQLAGVFDAGKFDAEVRTLSGEPLAPLKFEANVLDAGGRQLTDVAAESLDLSARAAGGELGARYEHLSSRDVAIVPAELARRLPNASLRSVAVRNSGDVPSSYTDRDVKQLGDELARRFAVAQFAGYSDGVRMVSAGNLASVSGAGQIAIPLALAALIIFNTMIGSIAERKREIHVYTSLGLAPLHVGALFVAEAMVYGLLGTVFGYVIGQGAAAVLLKLGWLGSQVTLNYSGTSAMLTMGLILLVVLASSIVPARMAARLAAPSIERTWRLPAPSGDVIETELPFTINRTAADGVLAYLAEFFDAHREGTIGGFTTDEVEICSGGGGGGGQDGHRELTTIVWLAPFDLGIRQRLTLRIQPGRLEDIYDVRVTLVRISGDEGSWRRMNRPFLTALRRQFLQWRSLSPRRMLDYVRASREPTGVQASSSSSSSSAT